MDQGLIQKLQYSYAGGHETFSLPFSLQDSLQLITGFFANNSNNKLCLVFPSRESTSQWLSFPIVIEQFLNDFVQNSDEIFKAHLKYHPKEKLILNNLAIVEWVGRRNDLFIFKHKENKGVDEIGIALKNISKLQRISTNRPLSSLQKVKEALKKTIKVPIDDLLEINTDGNRSFIQKTICIVGTKKKFTESISNILIAGHIFQDYIIPSSINENGSLEPSGSNFIYTQNLGYLALHLSEWSNVSKIIIDGFSSILERSSDFSDIDAKKIPTILITDLSEVESFDLIGNYGFEFFNFTKQSLRLNHQSSHSPFCAFDRKLNKYYNFNLIKEIRHNADLEKITNKIYSIEKDESNNDLTTLKINLVQLTNVISRISHIPSTHEIVALNQRLNGIENLSIKTKLWLGNSYKPIEESISTLSNVIEKLESQPTEKCIRLKSLMNQKSYDYVICTTEDEAQALRNSLPVHAQTTHVISVADVNDNLLTSKPVKAIITGWAKSSNVNRILSSFLFSELTLLFYQFENKYYNSLQRRNRQYNENIKSTVSKKGLHSNGDLSKSKGFDDFYSYDADEETTTENEFDIVEFELKLDNAQFSKYRGKGNLVESIKAKRVDFENDSFIYSSESHKFLVINELIEKQTEKANIRRKKIDVLMPGDVIALINTDRDILAELVEKNTNKQDLTAVRQWTDLWKKLLRGYFDSTGRDFKRLVDELRKHGCKKHEVTIKTWLQDENRIGPDDDSDLICIALMTNSKLLYDNIGKVREAIRKMTGWRMKASDFITEKIKVEIHGFANSSIINKKISVEGLGGVIVLKVVEVSNTWENIDIRYVHRLLQKEII